MMGTKAVLVHPPEEGKRLRLQYPSRVVSSRMVRRCKPQEGACSRAKAKSRWCVRGNEDADAHELAVYAPTP
eukprot:2917116-Pyramimonas_sp.AAC.1